MLCHGPQSGTSGCHIRDDVRCDRPVPVFSHVRALPGTGLHADSREQAWRRAGVSALGNTAGAAKLCDWEEREKEEARFKVSPQLHPPEKRMGGRGKSCHLQLEVKMAQFGVQLESLPA